MVDAQLCYRSFTALGRIPLQHATVVSHLVDSSPSDDTAAGWKATLPTRTDSPIVDPTGSSDAFALLRESNVHVTLLCGTKDVLYAHSELYDELCDQNRVRLHLYSR